MAQQGGPWHHMQISFDNWEEFLRTHREQERDPLHENFNWWYWCGFKNDEERNNAIQRYEQSVAMIPQPFYEGNTNAIDQLIANNTLSRFSGEIVKNTIQQLHRDVIQREPDTRESEGVPQHADDNTKRLLFRVLFIIYGKEAENGKWFVQGEDKILYRLFLALNEINHPVNTIEPLLYYIWVNCIIKTPLKEMLFPCNRGTNDFMRMLEEEGVSLYPNDKLSLDKFTNWIFSLLIIKKYKNNFTHLLNANKQQRNNFYSSIITVMPQVIPCTSGILCNQQVNERFRLNILKIFGKLLVSKDPTQFLAYIASYWCAHLPEDLLLDNSNAIDDIDDYAQLAQLYAATLTRSNVYDNPIDENEFDRIYRYFTRKRTSRIQRDSRLSNKKTKFNSLVNLAVKKSWKVGKTIEGAGDIQLFVLPKKFVIGIEIWDEAYNPGVDAVEPEAAGIDRPRDSAELTSTEGDGREEGGGEEDGGEEEEGGGEEDGGDAAVGLGAHQTPYFGAQSQEFFIHHWGAWSEANIGDPLSTAYGEFTNLAAAVGGGRYGANSPTFVPFLYLVANRNGGNYDITQGQARGGAVNWQNNFNAQQLQDLNQAADNFTQWANQHNPQLIRVLMVFLTDVNQNPVDIRAGGRRKTKKKRKRYKSFKKSNRKLNRTIKLR